MSTADLISADVSDTQITRESSGSFDPSDERKHRQYYLCMMYVSSYLLKQINV